LEHYADERGHIRYINDLMMTMNITNDTKSIDFIQNFVSENFEDMYKYLDNLQENSFKDIQRNTSHQIDFDQFLIKLDPETITLIIINQLGACILK